jgi:transposase
MAFFKPKDIHGHTYWYIVESVRTGKRVKTVNLAYLGKADDLLARLERQADAADRLKSFSHGGVAVLLSLAERLGLAELIDRHVSVQGKTRPRRRMLSVGETLVMAAVGRALHPTSKRAWAAWARGTTLGRLGGFDPTKLTSQFFWDQMDLLPSEALAPLQAELARRVIATFKIDTDSLFYDTTNFYTFIDSRNARCDLAQRGKNKQKRNDLRQFHLGLLVARDGWVPLLARLFRGNHNDVTTFPHALDAIGRHCVELDIAPGQVTVVCDKGNLSKKNWGALDASGLGHVVSLVPGHYKKWTERPLPAFERVDHPDFGELGHLRGQGPIAGKTRTFIVLDSPTLRDGQLRGLQQQLRKPLFALARLQHALDAAKRRRRKDVIERQLTSILRPAVMARLIAYDLQPRPKRPGYWRLDWTIDMEVYAQLRDCRFGRRLLATNRHDWTTADIIAAYWGQSEAELVFRHLKDPEFLALRPQHHWTDQKVHVHSLCCVIGYLLAALVRRRARQLGYNQGLAGLLAMLSEIRMVLRTQKRDRPGRPRIAWQLEETDPAALRLYNDLVLPQFHLGPTSS